jgi:diguanylate cyclase (GGDEF)-like protein
VVSRTIPHPVAADACDPALDRLAELAVAVLGVPVVLLSLRGDRRQHLRAAAGAGSRVVALARALGADPVAEGEPVLAGDLRRHPVLGAHPAVRGGIRAYAGTPLRDGAGGVVGAVCAVDTAPRTWTAGDLATLEAFAAAAGAEIEARASRRQVEQAASLSQGQNEILRRVARGDALPEVLEATVRHVERHVAGMVGSVLLLSDDGLRLHDGVGPSLPPGYRAAVDGIEIGDAVGSCGTAAHHRTLVVADDIATDPRWADFHELALGYGLRACWSSPVLATDGTVLGTFALYYGEPRTPTPAELRLIGDAAALAGIAIERARTERTLVEHATRDTLTGLWNRRVLLDHLGHDAPEAGHAALFFIDVDRFKIVNDTLGHHVGDDLLRQLADRLRRVVRDGDVLARLGGDEMALLTPGCASRADAEAIAERLLDAMRAPFSLAGTGQRLRASVGVALADRRTRGDGLLAAADLAMYRAKAAGGGTYAVFDDALREAAGRSFELETALPGAGERDELGIVFQPILRLSDRAVVAFEALVRWRHPTLGPVPPDEFIPVAEQRGDIVEIGRWVLERACAQVARASGPAVHLAVNVSPRQFADPGLVDEVAGILRGTGLAARRLTLEITEGLLLEDACAVGPTLEALRRLGVRIALDDFGTGYSSLAYLRRFPIDRLKIDRSFIGGLHRDPEANAITIAILGMAGALDLPVVAEGIETEEQAWALHDLGCGFGQGYLFARPASADAFSQLR